MAQINQFGKGIALNCGFDLGAQQLLDSRSIVADRTELEAMPDIRRANGLAVWIQDEKKLVVWDEPNSAWVEVSGDTAAFSEALEEAINNVNDTIDDVKVYAGQVDERIDSVYEHFATKITDLKTQISEIEVDDTFYSDKSYALTSAHGGLASGTDVAGWKIKDILKNILFPLKVPTLKISGTSTLYKLSDTSNIPSIKLTIGSGDFSLNSPASLLYDGSEITTLASGESYSSLSVVVNQNQCTFKATTTPNISDDETDPAILAWKDKTITSNTLTTFAVRPLFYAWSTVEEPEFPKVYADIFAPNSEDANYTWSTDPTELLTQSEKTVTLNFAAQTTAAHMVIVSPYKITQILNPSSFDITSSFTETQSIVSDTSVHVDYGDDFTYLYVSNITSQEKAYPLTVTLTKENRVASSGGGVSGGRR